MDSVEANVKLKKTQKKNNKKKWKPERVFTNYIWV